jgi:hypothetical protein
MGYYPGLGSRDSRSWFGKMLDGRASVPDRGISSGKGLGEERTWGWYRSSQGPLHRLWVWNVGQLHRE